MLAIRDLRHAYDGRTVVAVPAFELARGEPGLVLGPSGSGKSTLMAAIAGLLVPTTGSVRVHGTEVTSLGARARDAFRARHVGFVPQSLHLVGVLSARENLRLARGLAGLPPDEAWIESTLAALGLAAQADRRASRLSVGEAQRVAIARAVANRPSLVLADEPTSALDDASCERALDLLLSQCEAAGATLLVATHDRRIRERFARRLEL